MDDLLNFVIAAGVTFGAALIGVPVGFALVRQFGLYTIVHERRAHVYVLFGKVLGIIDEPGLYILPLRLGVQAFLVHWFGQVHVLDLRLDQEYLRSQGVNSEEGAPMGIGVWYEMYVSDPVAYLFKNADPRGSLRANVSNATVRTLSNLALDHMLTDRHAMSRTVRTEVTPKSDDWGYQLGSVYIRKVHFRDHAMIKQIEEKVVNRLRQVTSSISQTGNNQVRVIGSTAEREAAVEFARAAAKRPQIVGAALQRLAEDDEILEVMFDILEIQRIVGSGGKLTLVPPGANVDLLKSLVAADRS